MEKSLKTGFAQIFSCCPKNLSCPKFGGAAAPLAPPARTPMELGASRTEGRELDQLSLALALLVDVLNSFTDANHRLCRENNQ